MPGIPVLKDAAAETCPRAWIVTVNADLPGLHLKARDVLAVRSQERWDCDSLYQTVTGDIVRMQTLFNGTVEVTAPDGSKTVLCWVEIEGLICGRVIEEGSSARELLDRMRR